jgi:predicted PurR-regulated permease PerM
VDWLKVKGRLPRWLGSLVVLAALGSLVALVFYLGLAPLLRQLGEVVRDLKGTLEALVRAVIGDRSVQLFGEPMTAADLAQRAADNVRQWLGQPGRIAVLAAAGINTVFSAVLTAVLVFYFLLDGSRIVAGLIRLAPPRRRLLAERLRRNIDPILKRYFFGVAVVVVYTSIAAYVGLGVVLGLHHALLLALLTGFLELIPVVGPGASAVIAGMVAVHAANNVWSIVAYTIYAIVLRISIDQLLGPYVLGRAARVHPTLVMFGFLSGGLLFGIAGVILAVPGILAFKIGLATIYGEAEPTGSDSGDFPADIKKPPGE